MNFDELKTVDPWTWERIAFRIGVSAAPRRSSARQWTGNKRAGRARQRPTGSDLRSDLTGRRLMAMMMPRPTDRNPQARRRVAGQSVTIPAPSGPHWYVDSTFAPGYCAACNTPRENRRHVPRAA